jgi:hypothetical protein
VRVEVAEGREREAGVWVMSDIPLDLQKRCEQRWAARFCRPKPSTTISQKQQPQGQDQPLAAPGKGKTKEARKLNAGFRSPPTV